MVSGYIFQNGNEIRCFHAYANWALRNEFYMRGLFICMEGGSESVCGWYPGSSRFTVSNFCIFIPHSPLSQPWERTQVYLSLGSTPYAYKLSLPRHPLDTCRSSCEEWIDFAGFRPSFSNSWCFDETMIEIFLIIPVHFLHKAGHYCIFLFLSRR
jgi:hypothetical protein